MKNQPTTLEEHRYYSTEALELEILGQLLGVGDFLGQQGQLIPSLELLAHVEGVDVVEIRTGGYVLLVDPLGVRTALGEFVAPQQIDRQVDALLERFVREFAD